MQERDKAFYEAYRKAWDNGAKSYGEAVTMAINSPTTRLWISERYLYLVINTMKRQGRKQSSRGSLYDRLYERYKWMKQTIARHRATDAYIVRSLIYMPTKGFHISRKTADRILKRMRRQKGRLDE